MRLGHLLRQLLLVCVFLFAVTEQSIADSFSDAQDAFNAGNDAKAFKLYRLSAEQGNARAQYIIGNMYRDGLGSPQDNKAAIEWYQLSAKHGDVDAQFSLGEMYYKIKDIQNYKEAAKWYRLAAEQASPAAQFLLGTMFFKGEGLPQDYVSAHMWLNLSAANTAESDTQKRYAEFRDLVAKQMTTKQIVEAQELSKRCAAKKFKGC